MSRLLLVLALLSFAPALRAQSSMEVPLPESPMSISQGISTVQGAVRYQNGKPAVSIVVSLVSAGNGTILTTRTDSSGFYAFRNLRSGDFRYDVEVNEKGYVPVHELVISCDLAPVSLFITLIREQAGSAAGAASVQGRKIPEKAQVEYRKGVSSMSGGKLTQAVAHFTSAVGICPFYFDSYLKLSAAEADQHHFARAQQMIDRAMRLNKHSSLVYSYFGYLRMREGKSGQAKKQFRHAIRLNPSDWLAQLELGRILLNEKQARAAFPHLVVAHQVHPQLPSVHLLYYDDLILLNKKPAALAELNDILARFPKIPEAAKLRRVRGPLEAAIRRQHR